MPQPATDEFVEKVIVAFERCLLDRITTFVPATPPLTTFVPVKSSRVVTNVHNECWCPLTLDLNQRHGKYLCPYRPVWKLGENYRFRPCRHAPLYISRCTTCVDLPRLARDFVDYASRQNLSVVPPDPDLDMVD